MSEYPPYPDIGKPDFQRSNECTKRSLLTEKWIDCHSFKFPSRTFGDKQRKFNAKWLSEYTWLRYSQSKDAVYCAYCVIFGKVGAKERTFIQPVCDWKNFSTLVKRHQKEACHHDSCIAADLYLDVQDGKLESIVKQLSSSTKMFVERNRHILRKIIEVIVLCGKQNIPLRGHTEETSNFMAILQAFAPNDQIVFEHLQNAPSNAKYTSPEIQNELINICASQVKVSLVDDCKQSPCYAIMVDEATDKSTKEQLSLCVRFVDGGSTVREEFLGFVECQSIKGTYLATVILNFLEEAGLDITKIRAQCYDGASNMSGKHRGVQALIKERVPEANYVHCRAHCLNLALVHSSKVQCVRTMMSTVQDIAFAFDYSAKRLTAFRDELSQDAVTQDQLAERSKLRTLCETRWTSRADALSTFKNAFPVVVHALESLQANNDDKAGQYVAAILRFDFIISLVVAEHVLRSTVALTNLLQKTDMDIMEAVNETKIVLRILNNERNDQLVWDALYDTATGMAAEFEILPSKPRVAGRQQNRDNYMAQNTSDYWKVTLYYVFVDHLLNEMDSRILRNEARFSAEYLLPTKLNHLDATSARSLFDTYSSDLDGTYDQLENEIARWKVKWDLTDRPNRLAATLEKTCKDLYPMIHTILTVLLTMPPTSASCERSFSAMKRIKSYLRSTMTSERMSSLAMLHIHKDLPIDVEMVINTFASIKCRKMDFF